MGGTFRILVPLRSKDLNPRPEEGGRCAGCMSEEPKHELTGIVYQCLSCGSRVTSEELTLIPEIKCPFCGYRILKKVRPPIVKNIKAR